MMRSPVSIVSIVVLCTLVHCAPKKDTSQEKPVATTAGSDTTLFEVTEDKSSLAQYYHLDHIKEWYPERVLPPVFDYDIDLSKKTLTELWLLRNEIFARNGYLFEDAVLRGHFNQYKWYQPIFDVDEFTVQLNAEEQAFVAKVSKREKELAAGRYTKSGAYDMISMDHVFNLVQFKSVDNRLLSQLAKNNFAIVPARHEQLFHVYDVNHYQYIPNFITTDLYLQVLHKHFSSVLKEVEEAHFVPLMNRLLANLYRESLRTLSEATDPRLQAAARFSTTYLGVAYSLITDKVQAPGDPIVAQELAKIKAGQDRGSAFLGSEMFMYSSFVPRGNYTRSDELKNYFRCIKWLNTAPIVATDDEQLLAAVMIAALIRNAPDDLKAFRTFNEGIRFIVGEEDHASIGHLVELLAEEDVRQLPALGRPELLQKIRVEVKGKSAGRIRPGVSNPPPTILFTAGRYTMDAEILSRLVHVLRPAPKRPFPKGLDVFAAFGNPAAEDILINELNESKKWPAYADSLAKVKTQFASYNQWDKNTYSKTLSALLKLGDQNEQHPLFMKTPAWSKKSLSTSLAAWTELKHDLLLYAESPYGAQAAEGGGPPPPRHVSYVEPNVAFWKSALELLDFQEREFKRMDLLDERMQGIIWELREIGNDLLTVSRKQLANEPVTAAEFQKLSYLGGQIEYLTFRIFGSDHLPEKEREVSLVADVYNFNGRYLEEAVGLVDEIYVVVEINGKPHLAKGAVFSYYEFTSDKPLSDDEWKEQVRKKGSRERPEWMREVMVEVPSLESKATYSF